MIKSVHGIRKNWQESQCIAGNYSCEGLDCTYDDCSSPELISLSPSFSRVIEKIAPSVSNLASIKSCTGNDPNLCISGPCQKKKKTVIIQVVAVISSMFLLLAITIFRLMDEIYNEAFGIENYSTDFVIGIPKNSNTVCKIPIEVSFRCNEIFNQAFELVNHYFDSVMDLVGAILRIVDEIIKEAFGFENHYIDSLVEIPQKTITGVKILIGAILRLIDEIRKEPFGFETHYIGYVIEIPKKTIIGGKTLIAVILKFIDEIIKTAFGFENHSSVIEIPQKTITGGKTLIGATLSSMDEIAKEAFGFENHSIDSVIRTTKKTITEGKTLIGLILRFIGEIIKEAFGFEKHSIDILRFIEEINNGVLGFENRCIDLKIEIQRTSITGLINKKAFGFRNHCIDMVMGIPLNSFIGCKILIEAIFKFINEIAIEAFGFKNSCINLVIEMPRNSTTGCKTLISTDIATLTAAFQNINSDERGSEGILNAETSTNIPLFMCEICVESKPEYELFHIKGCLHFYCIECIINYVASKLQENLTSIRCPVRDCQGLLDPEYCRAILPLELFDRWGKALCEFAILGTEKFYCPFKDCSMLLINDLGDSGEINHSLNSRERSRKWWSFVKQQKRKHNDNNIITQSECPYCNRLFCAQCKVSWHLGFSCAEFKRFNTNIKGREDEMMEQLAKNKKWKRCPKCRYYVERTSGCTYIKCRCGFAFCYNCTAPRTSNYHICSKCKH